MVIRCDGVSAHWRRMLLTAACATSAALVGCEADTTSGNPGTNIAQQPPMAGMSPGTALPGPTNGDNTPAPQQPGTSVPGPGVVEEPAPMQPAVNEIPAGQQPIPCNVAQTVGTQCGGCHGAKLDWGAPMKLVSHEDFHAEAPISKGRKVYEVAAERIVNEAAPMPPAGVVAHEMISPLSDWLAAGAPAGTEADRGCMVDVAPTEEPGGGEQVPLPEDAVCYELTNHGGQTLNDSPFMVPPNETYVEFYFDVPWEEEVAAISWRTVYDNTAVLHHWLLFQGDVTGAPGGSRTSTGSHIGANVELVAGWAVGGNDVAIPDGVAMQMPGPGGRFLVEWHFFNQTGVPAPDSSGVEICVVPKGSVDPKKIGGLTWLGTENFNGLLGMPAGAESKFSGTCTPSRRGLGPDEPIRIFGWLPHMHLIGKHMETVINRADGTKEVVFDKPFQFDRQIFYQEDPMIDMYNGDTITATCTFFNNTAASVVYGPSTTQEMCYQFTFSYPAGALANGVPSLNGATNTCW